MKSKLALSSAVALVIACGAIAQDAKPSLQLTEDQLLRQIETLSPRSGDPLTKAPASVTEDAKTTAVPASEEPAPKKPKGATEIKADTVDFNQKTQQAVFTGRVIVNDPEFDLTCEKLTAYLKSEKPAGNGAAPATPAPKTADGPKSADAPKKKSGGLDRAVAEGKVVITQEKIDADGKATKSIGRAARADYSATTGEMILSGNPEVQQGINTWVAVDPSTKMYMRRDGTMRADRRTEMVIRDQGNQK